MQDTIACIKGRLSGNVGLTSLCVANACDAVDRKLWGNSFKVAWNNIYMDIISIFPEIKFYDWKLVTFVHFELLFNTVIMYVCLTVVWRTSTNELQSVTFIGYF